MRTLVLIIISLLFMNTNAQSLKRHQWKHRIVIIHTADEDSEIYQQQLQELLTAKKYLKERKIVLYKITKTHFELIDFSAQANTTKGKRSPTLDNIIEKNEAFEIILIGLDGGVKLRKNTILTSEKLCNTIDSMPMRQREMRRKKCKK